MAYGYELTNKNGEILFTTEEPYSVLQRTSSYVNESGDGGIITTPAAGELTFARPQDGESGVIASGNVTTLVGSSLTNEWRMLGTSSKLPAWGIARGHKRFNAKGISNTITSPSTSGYGFECYDSNGAVVFSSQITNALTVEAAFELPFGDTVQYKNPSTAGSFNNLYVLLPGVLMSNLGSTFSGFSLGGSFSPNNSFSLSGTYAHFDNSTEEITIFANGNGNTYNTTTGEVYQYDDLMQDNGSGNYFISSPLKNFVMIVRVNE